MVSAEPVGDRMAGPAIRAYELARALAADVRVTLAAPAPSALGDERFELLEAGLADYDALIAAVRDHDVVVAQLLPPRLLARIWREPARLVVDLYNPTVVEAIEATRGKPAASRARLNRIVGRAAAAHLAAADLTLCASERQRDLWLGVLAGRELLEPDALERFAVVPVRRPHRAAAARRPAGDARPARARGRPHPAVGRRDLGLARRADRDPRHRPPARRRPPRLPGRQAPGAARARRARRRRRARSRSPASSGWRARGSHFNHDWVPYEQRGAWLLEADLGVSAHPAHLETRFAYRTRIADYLWAGLPVVDERGRRARRPRRDAAASAARSPRATTPRSPHACAELLADPGPARVAVAAAADELRWDRVVQPLLDFCHSGAKRAHNRHRARAIRNATIGQYAPIAMETLTTDGPATLTRKLADERAAGAEASMSTRDAARGRREPHPAVPSGRQPRPGELARPGGRSPEVAPGRG